MPIHDWTRVDAGTFLAFRMLWISPLMGTLNAGVLPNDHYAMAAWHTCPEGHPQSNPGRQSHGSTALDRHLVIRHASSDRVVAMIEIVSPSNKDRRRSVRGFAEKVVDALEAGIHVMLPDLFPPGAADPQGLHGAVWSYFDRAGYPVQPETPVMLASYAWDGDQLEAYLQPMAVGDLLVPMPLFLTHQRYVNVPLEETYQSAYRGMPARWTAVLDGGSEGGLRLS